jgi:hypothetical protein
MRSIKIYKPKKQNPMKKLLTYSTLCIVAGILLSSCSSNVSIAKRHYRSGYYVAYSKKAPAVNYSSAKPERKPMLALLPSPELPGIPEQYVSAENQINTTLIDVPADKKTPLKVRHTIAKQIINQPVTIAKSATQTVTNNVSSYEGNVGGDRGERAALSLLWIVIIVILILWILGLAAGVGGFINLLLVIALILLILWLLRII